MTRSPMTPLAFAYLAALILGFHECAAVVCDGTVDDSCNGLNGTCTDTGLCFVGPDGVNCESTKDNDVCGDIGITSIPLYTISTELSEIPTSDPVEYKCEFINNWTAARHPNDYPSGNAHWSPMVIVTHSDSYEMWAPDVLATDGVKRVAETGSTSILTQEVNAAGSDIGSSSEGTLQFNSNVQQQTITGVMVDESHPYVSSITMIAPSPDWISGFYNFNAAEDGKWYRRFTLETYPFDSGTDSGDTYTSSNTATDPQEPIFQLTENTVPSSGVFLSPDNSTVDTVATWDCALVEDPRTETTSSANVNRCLTRWKVGMFLVLALFI